MIGLAADENLDGDIVQGLRDRLPTVDLIRVQDAGLAGADDPTVLEWAAREGRVLLTHDIGTMIRSAYERVKLGLPMPGVVEIRQNLMIGRAIEEILLLAECSREGEWDGQVVYLPLR